MRPGRPTLREEDYAEPLRAILSAVEAGSTLADAASLVERSARWAQRLISRSRRGEARHGSPNVGTRRRPGTLPSAICVARLSLVGAAAR